MTVSNQTSSASFIGDGATTTFPCAFKVFDADHIEVYVDGVLQTLSTHYTVSGVGGESFNVVFTAAPAAQAKVSVFRVVPLLQETDYLSNDAFPAETHERALDLLTMMVQQVAGGNTGKAIRYPPSDAASLTGLLPVAASRASKLLGFDSEGEAVPVLGADLGTFSVGEAHTWTAQQIMEVGSDTDGWVLRNLSGQTLVKMRNTIGGVGALIVNDAAGNEGRIEGGSVDPEGNRGAPTGTLYLRSSGGAGTTAYLKESGSGNTGWRPLGGSAPTVTSTLSGSTHLVTGIPANARRVVIHLNSVVTNGANPIRLVLGTSGGLVTAGYDGTNAVLSHNAAIEAGGADTTGFRVVASSAAQTATKSKLVLEQRSLTSGDWSCTGIGKNGASTILAFHGTVALNGVLDRFRLETASAFTAGSISWAYE